MPQENILVIKLGALGDFIYAIGPMQAIKRHHKTASITLLTRPSFAELGNATKLFNNILIDPEPKFWQLKGLYEFGSKIKSLQFDRIYDLQTSDRTGFYYKLFSLFKKPEWSGIVPGCSHHHHYDRHVQSPERPFSLSMSLPPQASRHGHLGGHSRGMWGHSPYVWGHLGHSRVQVYHESQGRERDKDRLIIILRRF